ncbi:MAG: Gfo/Idh/MocA family oxidoreductase [Limnochordia bacterium]|jgi:hypothetical protein
MAELKLGMIGLDTSHCQAFSGLLNNKEHPHHVPGATITHAFPGGSEQFSLSRERVERITAEVRDNAGVEILDSIEAVAEKVDAILLTSVDGRVHLEEFRKLAPFGKPVFIDKPFATSLADAKEILALSEQYKAPVLSCSSIRFSKGIDELGQDAEIFGCEAFGPAAILDDFPGLFWYGIHTAEVLFSKMGAGCKEVSVRKTDSADMVTGVWEDGRIGTLYGFRFKGLSGFGATVYSSKGIEHGIGASKPPAYALMLDKIIEFFRTGVSPIETQVMLEIVAFLEAANKGRESGEVISL